MLQAVIAIQLELVEAQIDARITLVTVVPVKYLRVQSDQVAGSLGPEFVEAGQGGARLPRH